MAAYLVVKIMMTPDIDWTASYREAVPKLLEEYGGKYLARTRNLEILEGQDLPCTTAAILKFPSLEMARSFLHSEEYRPYRESRMASSSAVIVGLEDDLLS